MARKPYVSIDIETTGLDPSWCQVLEFGAVIDDWTTPVEKLPSFHCYIVHERIVGDPFALALNHEILRRIANRGKVEYSRYGFLQPEEVGVSFHHFLTKHFLDPKHIQAAGKNFGSFDRPFLATLPEFNRHINFKHRSADPGPMFWNPDEDDCVPDTKKCMQRAGIEGEVAHTAVEDAIKVIEMIRFAKAPGLWTSRDLAGGLIAAIQSEDRSPFPGGPGKLGL